jgi:hypothetical protein
METVPLLLLQQSIMVLLAPEDVFRVSACSRALSRVWDAHLLPKLRWRLPRHYPAIRREGLLAHPDLSLTWPEEIQGFRFDPWFFGAMNDGVELLQFLEDRGARHIFPHAMDMAASRGHLPAVTWFHQHGQGCTEWAMDSAATAGHLHVVKWLHDFRTEGCSEHAMNGAARKGHLNIVQWLHENRTEGCNYRAMADAKENGHTHVFEWLKANPEVLS